jgi:hypothetical protein
MTTAADVEAVMTEFVERHKANDNEHQASLTVARNALRMLRMLDTEAVIILSPPCEHMELVANVPAEYAQDLLLAAVKPGGSG